MSLYDSSCLETSVRDYANMAEGLQIEHSNYESPVKANCQVPCYKQICSFKCTSARQQSDNSPPRLILALVRKNEDFQNKGNRKCCNSY